MGPFAAPVLMRVGIEQAEADPDVAFGGSPQGREDPDVPGRGGGREQGQVEGVVVFVDLAHAPLLLAELCRLALQPFELAVGKQQAGPLGDLGFESAPQPVNAAQFVQVQGSDQGAAAGPGHDEAFAFQAAQRLADRDEADLQHVRDLAQGELLPGRQGAGKNRPAELHRDLLRHGSRLDRADRRPSRPDTGRITPRCPHPDCPVSFTVITYIC